MRILGIDPSLTRLGWGVIEIAPPKIIYIASGIIPTDNSTNLHKRLYVISNTIEEVINLYNPSRIAMEETFINSNASSSLKLAYVRGALMAAIGKMDAIYHEYAANKIKKTITGVGHADKDQVKHMVKIIIRGINKEITLDESDALATAYSCSAIERF